MLRTLENLHRSLLKYEIAHAPSTLGWRLSVLLLATSLTAGCMAGPPSVRGPTRLFETEKENASVQSLFKDTTTSWRRYLRADSPVRTGVRNEILAARMYAIDVNYTDFEHALNAEGQTVEFWAKLASGTLTTVATAVPVDQTVRGLNAIAHGVDLGQTAYSDVFFRKQLIQNMITAMRTARHERRAVIRSRMTCPSELYPLGIALSDVESYYRAGTLETGIMRLTQSITSEEHKTKRTDDVAGGTAAPMSQNIQSQANATAAAADTTNAVSVACNATRIGSLLDDSDVGDSTAMKPPKQKVAARKPTPARGHMPIANLDILEGSRHDEAAVEAAQPPTANQ